MTGVLTKTYFYLLFICLLVLPSLPVQAQAKSLAIISADKNKNTLVLVETLNSALENSLRLADPELIKTVVDSAARKSLFNLSLDESKNIGTGIGCSHYLILKAENLRRSSFKKDVYYEAYAVAFLVNAHTGELTSWKHFSAEADNQEAADKALILLFSEYAREIPASIVKNISEVQTIIDPSIYEIRDDSESGLRTPLPFRRFSPISTDLAQHLRIEAVVDIEVAIDDKGYITQTKILRWAGFGLDEAVTETVRRMNFRPAILNKKAIPARFLLRYNFRIPDPTKGN